MNEGGSLVHRKITLLFALVFALAVSGPANAATSWHSLTPTKLVGCLRLGFPISTSQAQRMTAVLETWKKRSLSPSAPTQFHSIDGRKLARQVGLHMSPTQTRSFAAVLAGIGRGMTLPDS